MIDGEEEIPDDYDEFKAFNDILGSIDTNNYTFVSYDSFEGITVTNPKINVKKVIECAIKSNSINPHDVCPNYLKRTEAEEKLEKNDLSSNK